MTRTTDKTPRRASGAVARARRKRDDEVVAAAAKVFYERGYSAATVQDIADELGILKGSLYHYIKTKEDLLFRVFEQVHKEVEAILEEVLAVEGPGPARAHQPLRAAGSSSTTSTTSSASRSTTTSSTAWARSAGRAVIAWRRRHDRFLRDLIREAQEQGLADASVDAGLLANCVFATVIWPYRWFHAGSADTPESIADTCTAFVSRGLVGGFVPA